MHVKKMKGFEKVMAISFVVFCVKKLLYVGKFLPYSRINPLLVFGPMSS